MDLYTNYGANTTAEKKAKKAIETKYYKDREEVNRKVGELKTQIKLKTVGYINLYNRQKVEIEAKKNQPKVKI